MRLYKALFGTILGAVLSVCCAYAFLHDQMENAVGDLGPELVNVVSLAGEIQSEIARPSADDLIENRSEILKRVGELKGATEAISQLLSKMSNRQPLSLGNLDARRRAELLRFVSPELRGQIEKSGVLEMSVVLKIYLGVKNEVQRDAISFANALSGVKDLTLGAVNNVGITRGALTASLGRLVEFSGRIQQLAYAQKAAG
jgi:hypothetical protein